MLREKDVLKIKNRLKEMGFKEGGQFYIYKTYQSEIKEGSGSIIIHGASWADNEVEIDIRYPRVDNLNLTKEKDLKYLHNLIYNMSKVTGQMNADLTIIHMLLSVQEVKAE